MSKYGRRRVDRYRRKRRIKNDEKKLAIMLREALPSQQAYMQYKIANKLF